MSLIPEWLPRQDSTSEPARRLPAPQYLRGGRPPHPRSLTIPHRPNHTRPYDVRPDANRERDDRNG